MSSKYLSISQASPDAVPVIPADEGPEGAALAPVAVGAHEAIRTRAIPSKLPPTHFPRPLQTHCLSTIVRGSSVRTLQGGHIRLVLTTGGGQGGPCTKTSQQRNCQHHHHHPHLQ